MAAINTLNKIAGLSASLGVGAFLLNESLYNGGYSDHVHAGVCERHARTIDAIANHQLENRVDSTKPRHIDLLLAAISAYT